MEHSHNVQDLVMKGTNKKKIIRNKFYLYYFMVKNPGILEILKESRKTRFKTDKSEGENDENQTNISSNSL